MFLIALIEFFVAFVAFATPVVAAMTDLPLWYFGCLWASMTILFNGPFTRYE